MQFHLRLCDKPNSAVNKINLSSSLEMTKLMCKTAEIVLVYYCTNYAGIVLISRKFIMVFTVDPLKKNIRFYSRW